MKKHQWTATLLSLLCTGLGMFYIGTPLMILGAVMLMAVQGFSVIVFFFTLGFLGAVVLPVMLGAHITGLIITAAYFTRKPNDPVRQQKKERQLATPWKIALRTAIGLALFVGALGYGYESGKEPFTKTPAEKQAVREAAVTYLEQKYNEPFEVTEVNYTWAVGTYSLSAHPKQDPRMEFRMTASDREPTRFSEDYYLSALWSFQLKEMLTSLVNELYPDSGFVDAMVYQGEEGEVVKNYSDLTRGGDQRVRSQLVELIVFADLTADNLAAEKGRTLALIRELPEMMVQSKIDVKIDFYPGALNTEENRAKIKADFKSFARQFSDDPITHEAYISDIIHIRSADGIEIKKLEKNTE
ncbi:NADH-quinone oxidoreductase subunit J [Paenibacillus sp. DMB20]|uniref:NADH-quinone oxidoreductase subunit J n=1 Tax=Paenibacillus sp. DMB20 TaxID=1642570 RepID=UPI000627E1A4|nr:NADH-quinone oxidoreductase subunit J [Paenibacillus sp. DMB20]KKO54668.1 hypothetical protein XI25_04990 [Paenibacillus sp. DMB20]